MHFYTMTITEDIESEYRSELKLWVNEGGDIWMQIGYDDTDPCATQGMAISADDARALITELQRLLKQIEPEQPSAPGQQLTLTPEKTVQKVNWSK